MKHTKEFIFKQTFKKKWWIFYRQESIQITCDSFEELAKNLWYSVTKI